MQKTRTKYWSLKALLFLPISRYITICKNLSFIIRYPGVQAKSGSRAYFVSRLFLHLASQLHFRDEKTYPAFLLLNFAAQAQDKISLAQS